MATTKAKKGSEQNPLLQNLVTVAEFAKLKKVTKATIYNHATDEDRKLEYTHVGQKGSVKMIDLNKFNDYTFAPPKFKYS